MENDTGQMPEATELPEEERPEEAPSAEQSALEFQGLGTGEQQQQPAAESAPPDPLEQLNGYERLLAKSKAEINAAKQTLHAQLQTGQISATEALGINQQIAQQESWLTQQAGALHQKRTSIQTERAAKKEQETLSLIPQWVDENVAKTEINYMTAHLSKKEGRTVTAEELGKMAPEEIRRVRDETIAAATEKSARLTELEGKLKKTGRLTDRERIELGDARMANIQAEKERHAQLFPPKPKPAAKQEPSYAEHFRAQMGDKPVSRTDLLRAIREGRV